jgi:cytochrome c553
MIPRVAIPWARRQWTALANRRERKPQLEAAGGRIRNGGENIVTKLSVAVAAIIILCGLPIRAIAGDPGEAALQYKIYCAGCHGFTGHGDGPNAATLATKPQDFADCGAMKKIPDDTMFKAIKGGGASVGLPDTMPPWASGLGDDEIHAIIAYIRGFCPKK